MCGSGLLIGAERVIVKVDFMIKNPSDAQHSSRFFYTDQTKYTTQWSSLGGLGGVYSRLVF